jgi:hypothetical protein
MESKPIAPSPEGARPILTVASQEDFAEALRFRRLGLGLTLADLDHLAGFHDGYAAHLERPFSRSGKRSFQLSRMGFIWLESLGLSLCLSIQQRTAPAYPSALDEFSARTIVLARPHTRDLAQCGSTKSKLGSPSVKDALP